MKTSGLSLSIAVLALGASTIYLAMQLSEERAHSGELATETRALNARIAELEKARAGFRHVTSGTFARADAAPGTSIGAVLPPPSAASSESRAAVVGPGGATVMNGAAMPHSEAFQKMMRAQLRAQNKQLYADAGTQLGLSLEDASKLVDLLTEQYAGGIGIAEDSMNPQERARLMNEVRRETDAKIAGLLGPERLKLLEQYQQTIPARQELDSLAHQIEGSDAASLSDDQRKRLLTALVDEKNRIPAPNYSRGTTGEDYRKAYFDWQDDYNTRVAAQFRSILNAEQYAAYDQYQQWQNEMNAQMRMASGPDGSVIYSAVAPGTIVGETAILTTTSEDERRKEP
jgi:hypothetical protein